MHPEKAVKIGVFLLAGGVVATAFHLVGGDARLDALVFFLAGFAAVACVQLLIQSP